MYIQTKLNLNELDNITELDNILEDTENRIEHKLITNNEENNFLLELKKAFIGCKSFYFSVAFINFSGLQLILDNLKGLEERGIKGKILTSTYLNFTEVNALKKLMEFSNIDLKIFITDEKLRGFHTKVYIFEYEENYKIYIGSSNLTQSALKSNEEWNVRVIAKKDDEFSLRVIEAYEKLLEESYKVD